MTFADIDGRLLPDLNILIFMMPFSLQAGDVLSLPEGRYVVRCALSGASYSVRRLNWLDEILLKLGVQCDPADRSTLAN